MISIQTNVNSLVAQQNLSVNSSFQSKTIQQLTSGYRINQSGDDAAGLAVANKFRSTVAELTQGVANGNDATAQLQIMDGGMSNISLILDRLKTLATQSASGTFTGNRTVLNSEFQNALSEIDRQAQSIGLNTGGLFAKNLDVFLGAGSGSSSLQNGIVTLGLTQSAVDSQSLGMRGMLAVNLTSGTLSGTNSGTDIGSTSATSVQNIVGNVTGGNANQQATAGYAALQFSGAGFSDAGKVSVSVNLAGVTDVATLVTAVNSAIQSAGNGTTAAATAFKNANVVASLHSDSAGGQQLAFSSGTAAFQVQAGDQMANALLGYVSSVGGVAKGAAVSGTAATTVTGATTTAGAGFSASQTVKLVVTGGGLASPVTLQLNTASPVSTTGAITDLQNQFSGSAALQAAGLSMSGSSTVGGKLSFNSASGQGFNIQVTGDSANLLGLGSFLADSSGNADYAKITASAAYSAATVTGSATSMGMAAGLEISLNGQASTALTGIDLTAGANAVAASKTSGATIGTGTGAVDITAANNKLDITVTNNGVATNVAWALNTNQVATNGTVASTKSGLNLATFGGYDTATGVNNNQFTVAVDGGAAQTVTLSGTYAAGAAGAASFLTDLNTALGATGVTASWDATAGGTLGDLTLTSATKGAASSVVLGAATYASKGGVVTSLATLKDDASFQGYTASALANNDKFTATVDGVAKTVTLDGTFTADKAGADLFMTALQAAVSGKGLTAGWDATTGGLALTSTTSGALSSVALSASTYASAAVQTSSVTGGGGGFDTIAVTLDGTHNNFNIAVDGGPSVNLVLASASYTSAAALVTEINSQIAAGGASVAGKVSASVDATSHKLILTSTTTGAGAYVNVSEGASNGALAILGFTAGTANGNAAAVNSGLTTIGLNASTTRTDGLAAAVNSGLTTIGLNANTTKTDGVADAPTTVASIAAQIQTKLGATATVTVSNDFKISIASTTKGANSSVAIATAATFSANTLLHLDAASTPTTVAGQNSSIGDIVSNLNAQFAANSTYQAAGLQAVATASGGTGSGDYVSIQSTNGTQFRLNAVGATTAATAGAITSTVKDTSAASSFTVGAANQFSMVVDGRAAVQVTVVASAYADAAAFLGAVQAAVSGKGVTAGWDATSGALTLTSATTGAASKVTVSAGTANDGLAAFGFGTGATDSGHQVQVTENTGFGIAGSTFVGASASSTGTAMSAVDAFGISNSQAFTFSAMKFGNDKQALTFSATDANGALETKTITLQNDKSINRAGASIDDAVAYINTQLQQSTSQPALQKIVAVKENVGGQEKINFVSSLSLFTVGVAATANADGLNGGAATYRTSASNGDGANMQVDSKEAAKAAVSAIATAIGKLGSAQAAVGKGQNQLYYAVNLAQSQITNFSAAESYLRDANVAQQAANLTKAQVLSQASIAAMAQANSAPQAILALLRG